MTHAVFYTCESRCMCRASICSSINEIVFLRIVPIWDFKTVICSSLASTKDCNLLFSSINLLQVCNGINRKN